MASASDDGLIQSFICYISNIFDTVLVYEHVGDINEKVHCHLLLYDQVGITSDAIKKSAPFKGLKLGNREHSFKSKFKCKRSNVIYDMTISNAPKYITYMSKGIYDPHYYQGNIWFEPDILKLKEEFVFIKSKTKLQVEAFDKVLGDQHPIINGLDFDPHEWLKGKVLNYIMSKYDGFNGAAAAEFKMLLVTFAWKRGYSPKERSKQYV